MFAIAFLRGVLSFLFANPVCPPTVSIENGHAHGNGTSVGSRYWFTCNKGFSLIGPYNIHCDKDGQWNGSLPKCAKGKETTNSTPKKCFISPPFNNTQSLNFQTCFKDCVQGSLRSLHL